MSGLVKDIPSIDMLQARGAGRRLSPKWQWALLVVAALWLVLGTVLAISWPFRESKVIVDLQEALQGKVTFAKFRHTFFPHPGCVAEDVTVIGYGNLGNASPITVRKLTMQTTILELVKRHVQVMHAEGVHVMAQKPSDFGGWRSGNRRSKTALDELLVTDSDLEFTRNGVMPFKFEIVSLSLKNPTAGSAIRFEMLVRNPKPPGELRASGTIGPWNTGSPSQTPLSGIYSFRKAKLGVFHGIAGTLSSQGSFQGRIAQLDVRGTTDTPDFEVTDSGHKVHLTTEFQARVDTRNGDVTLEQVNARLARSGVGAQGTIAGRHGVKGKMTDLGMVVRSGRIEDFLYLFLKDRLPPMAGSFSFRGRARLPYGHEPFKERVELQGEFGVFDATMTKASTQANLESLSERAEGEKNEDPERIVTNLKGHVMLSGGVASFSHLSFRVPGAVARLHGTYSLVTHRIDMHGRLSTKATLAQATSGVKSFLLKIISPVLKKNHHGGGVVALSVTGIYPHPLYKTAPIADPI